ncbi:SHOCT domain-containing protein [Caloranaerobacter ferrireducens]|nr:SHOCT domain-containing protein [Caloranaerobacter ferrireducens]
MNEETLEYVMSRALLKEILEKKLINEEEFHRIDAENKKTFNK